jgi:YD repeat-containing protein
MKRSTLAEIIGLFVLLPWLIAGGSPFVCAATPPVRVSVKPLDLSRVPSTEEIVAAGQLGGELHPTQGFRSKTHQTKVNHSFGKAIQAWNKHEYHEAASLFREHVKQYPGSPWNSEAALHVGCYAQYLGRYPEAQENFEWIIESNKGKDHPGARALLNKARLRLGALKASQDNLEDAEVLFRDLKLESPDWRHRTYAAHWIQRLSQAGYDRQALRDCGTRALAYLLEKRGKESEAREVMSLVPDTARGHSLESLSKIAGRYGHDLVALSISLPDIQALSLPAILHVNRNDRGNSAHFWILDRVDESGLELLEPQSSTRFRQSYDELSRQWSGVALVFSDGRELPGIRLSKTQMTAVSGGCCGTPPPEGNLGKPPGPLGCANGAPRWSVNMINLNLFMTDTPLWYTSPVGPPVEITLNYNSESATAYHEPFGNKWQFNYGSFLVVDPSNTVTVFMPDGKRDVYVPDGAGGYVQPYQVFNKLTKIADNHFELRFPDDTVYAYNIPPGTASLQPFLVEIRDAHGQSLQFGYDSDVQLSSITDAVGRSTSLTYNASGLVTQVTDPFGRSARFEYDGNRNLMKITDMGGYWSNFSYDSDIYLKSVENARGQWQFFVEPADGIYHNYRYPPPGGRMWMDYRITVTNPLGDKAEYFYDGYAPTVGSSWYVSPRDYVAYESETKNNFISAPKTKYELFMVSGHGEISSITPPEYGGNLWYGYDAKGNRTSITRYYTTTLTYNDLGRITSITDPKTITTELKYAANGVDLIEIKNGLGSILMTYNGTRDVTSVTNRLGHNSTMVYNGYGQITSLVDPRSIASTYIYNTNQQLDRIERDGKIVSSFTYDPVGRVRSRTDGTGLTLIYDYDNLNHITKITYPDGKYASYTYSGCCPRLLDRVTDRSGLTTRYAHDELERLIEVTDPAGFVTKALYDKNGNLAWLIDPKGNASGFAYDLNNRLIKKMYADGKSVSFTYDFANLLSTRTNARGIIAAYAYDPNDNLVSIAYSDGTPQVTYAYDDYNRMIQSYDGTGSYVYSYDQDSRLTGVDGPWSNDTLTFRYDESGQTGLPTGLEIQGGQNLSYQFDQLNRLAGIQIGSQSHTYGYPLASPLVASLTRPNGSVTSYQYDPLNRLLEIANKDSTGGVINKFAYTYNNQDLRASETRTNADAGVSFQNSFTTYDTNSLNQILSSTDPDRAFTYDDDGNMVRN